MAGIAQHVEHWVYNEKLDRQEIDGSLDKVEISDFKLDKDSVFRPEGTGEGNLTFDEVQRRYRNYFDKTPQAEFRAPDHRYIYIDVWEDIAHTGDTDFGKMAEDEIIEHIETAHRAELVGLMTLYPMEWPYRMDSSYEDVCGRNIAIDTDDLVLANQNMSVVFGTYGRRGKGSPTDWKEHLARRDRYHVSWPEYLVLLEIVLAKKQTINYVLNRYIDNSRRAIRSNVHDMIEQNAQLTVELSGILMRLNSVRYLRYMSHKHMFELTQRNLRVEEDSRQLQEVMQQVDKSLENVNNMMEIRHADDTKYILLFISIASLFGVLLQSEDVPILSLLSYRFGVGSAIILEVFTFAVILIGPEDIRQNHAPIHPPQAQRAKNEPPIRQGIMTIRPYTPQDRQKLCDLFAELIENHKEYISHGELQMGIATDRGELAPDFRNAWLRYLDRQTADPETEIMLAEQDGTPTGFVIYGINRDGAAPYGMIYDVGLLPRHRSRGTGSLLVRTALDALREKGIADCYLESGVDNHSAHRFFEKFGFGQVSAFLGRSCKRTIRTSVTSPVICCSLALSFTDGTGISYVSYFRSYPRPEFFEEAPEQVSFAIRPYPKTACPNRGCDSAAKTGKGLRHVPPEPLWLFRLSERVTSHRPSRRSGTEKREVRRCWSAWRQPARCGTHSERPQGSETNSEETTTV